MSNEFHWGGINVKSLCKVVLSDIWMVFAAMVITYVSLGIVGNMTDKPSYTSSTVVAVYPYNQMYTSETASGALESVGAVNEVINSEMFKTGLENRLAEPKDFSLFSRQISGTSILMLSVTSPSPENAYKIVRTALDYYDEISSRLVGNSRLEILTGPDFPLPDANESKILKYKPLLTLFMGFAMGAFLVLMYIMRRTYKTSSAIQSYYKNVRFFRVKAPASDRRSRRNKKKAGKVPNQEAVRKTSLELLQMLRAKKGNSIFVTSAAGNEGKTDITVSLAREMAASGKSVLIVETDSENSELSEYPGISDDQARYMLSDLLKEGVDLESVAVDIPELDFKVIFANKTDVRDDFLQMVKDVEIILGRAEKLADVVLVDGCIWSGAGDEQKWKEAADTSLAVCRQDKADFYAVDRMMTDLRENNSSFLGCILYGF